MKNKKYSKNEIAKTILKVIVAGGFVVACTTAPGLLYATKLFKVYDNNKLKRTLKNLEKKRYVNIYYKEGKSYFEMTKKGKKQIIKFDYEDMSIKKPKKWDGKWRLVLFDIPNKKKHHREQVRFKLKELGFYQFQKSAFVYPYECEKEITLIKNYWFVSKNIDYCLISKISSEQKLKKHFNL